MAKVYVLLLALSIQCPQMFLAVMKVLPDRGGLVQEEAAL